MGTTFKDSELKIKRAKKHISDLNDYLAAYIKRRPCKVVVEEDAKTPANFVFVLRVREEFPCDVSAYIGDAVHNLRSALDLLATALVIHNEGSPDNVYWPFGKDAANFEERVKATHIDRAAPDVVAKIRALKPYKGGDDALRGLHDLDIADKHRALIPVMDLVGIPDLITVSGAGGIAMFVNNRVGPLVDGMKLLSHPKLSNLKMGTEFNPALFIRFDKGQPFERQPVLETLHELTQLVERIVTSFEAKVSTHGSPASPASPTK